MTESSPDFSESLATWKLDSIDQEASCALDSERAARSPEMTGASRSVGQNRLEGTRTQIRAEGVSLFVAISSQ